MVTKFHLQELLADHKVIQELIISCSSFIWRAPTSSNKIKLAVEHQLLDLVFQSCLLVVIPSLEVFHLSEGKCSIWIQNQFSDGGIEDVFDSANINAIFVIACVEIIDGRDPAFVCVRVWEQVDNFLWRRACCVYGGCIVLHELLLILLKSDGLVGSWGAYYSFLLSMCFQVSEQRLLLILDLFGGWLSSELLSRLEDFVSFFSDLIQLIVINFNLFGFLI